MTATATLARFAAGTRFEQIPDEAYALAGRHVLDCIGVALAASVEPAGRIIADLARDQGGAPQARVLGSGVSGSAIETAWANGALAHLLDFDDTGFSHPTACILPAALAIAERERADGRRLLTAMVIGYEVFERLSVSARPYEARLRGRGYHPTSIYGCPAAAAAAGSLLGLDADQMSVAIGLAAANAGGLTQHFGGWGKGVHAGNAARAGVTGALLAAKGYQCDPEVIEGPFGLFNAVHGSGNYDLSQVGTRLGQHWAIVDPGLIVKAYPSCGGTLRAIDATLALRREYDLDLDQVEKLVAEIAPDMRETLRFCAPAGGFQGKFSLDYCIGAALLDGRVDLDTFSDAYASNPRMREALAKVEVVDRPEWEENWVTRKRSPVTVHLKDGRTFTREVEHPRGSRGNPLSQAEVLDKFRHCAARVLPPAQVERSIELLDDLEWVEDVSALVDVLVAGALVAV